MHWKYLSLAAGIATTALSLSARTIHVTEQGSAAYITEPVISGTLVVTVKASGTFEAHRQVEIGSELSGIVKKIYVDGNDKVRVGDLLATLDTSRLRVELTYADQTVAFALARLAQSDARLRERMLRHQRLMTARALSGGLIPSPSELDASESALARAVAVRGISRAEVSRARASCALVSEEISKAEIRSPLNGVVLLRMVDEGQVVSASFRSPALFMLAENLSSMELRVLVDEADIGAVKSGQSARVLVDAIPNHHFEARVGRIHLAPTKMSTTSQGGLARGSAFGNAGDGEVVTYEAALDVPNPDLLLRPGMSASVAIETATINGAVLVPNSAMAFTPVTAQFPAGPDRAERRRGIVALMPYVADRWKCPQYDGQTLGCVWTMEDGKPALAIFQRGGSDDSMTQVLSSAGLSNWASLPGARTDQVLVRALKRRLAPGTRVIVGSETEL